MTIHADMTVEDLLQVHPKIAGWLADRGIVCVRCGEPYWGTLRELAGLKGLDRQIDQMVAELIEAMALEG